MWLAMSVANALIVTLAFYLLIAYLDSAVVLELKKTKNKKLINDKIVIIDAIVTFIMTGVITYLRYPEMMLEMKILTTIFLIVMAALSVCDIKKKIVPNRIILVALAAWILVISIGIILHTQAGVALLGQSIIGGVISGVIFLLVYVLTKKKLGAGDVKFAFVLGLYMTSSRMFGGIFYGSILCCVFSLVMIALKKLTFKSGVPMIPFLYLGCLITYIIL